jgi:hypothetical protein
VCAPAGGVSKQTTLTASPFVNVEPVSRITACPITVESRRNTTTSLFDPEPATLTTSGQKNSTFTREPS